MVKLILYTPKEEVEIEDVRDAEYNNGVLTFSTISDDKPPRHLHYETVLPYLIQRTGIKR